MEALHRHVERIATLPEQGHLEVPAVHIPVLERELVAAPPSGQRLPQRDERVAARRERPHEVRGPLLIAVLLDVNVKVPRVRAPRAKDPKTYTAVTRLSGQVS
jgi:hypothetical protein